MSETGPDALREWLAAIVEGFRSHSALPGEPPDAGRKDTLIHLGHARLGLPRPDVERKYPRYPGRKTAGWQLVLQRAALPAGAHRIELHVIAENAAGGRVTIGHAHVQV